MPIDRFPHYTQLDSMDCGPTCLRMIAKYYGRRYSLETLRDKAFITREGVSMLGISDAAESIGRKLIEAETRLRDAVLGTESGINEKAEEASAVLGSMIRDAATLMRMKLGAKTLAAESIIKETEALSPLSVLRRGYSVTYGKDGKILREKADAAPGDMITTRLMDGMIASIVKEG